MNERDKEKKVLKEITFLISYSILKWSGISVYLNNKCIQKALI